MLDEWRRLAAATAGGGQWRWLGIFFSVVIVGAAIFVLVRILAQIETAKILIALEKVSSGQIALAALFMAGSYFSLTLYDFFALRTIGRSAIPYRVAATAGFASYAIGHNAGATALTCGLVRYHVYSSHGLSLTEVAKICFITGLTFWLGNICVAGAGLSLEPAAATPLTHLPPYINQAIGAALLCGCVGYVAWVSWSPRTIGRQNWSVVLPRGGSTIVQIAIGIFDLACCASAMYALLPVTPAIGWLPLATILISALLLGYASHTPGGLGVFDAAMLIGLPMFPAEPLLASLLLFRLVGYVVPGLLALLLLGARYAVLTRGRFIAS